MVASHWTAHIAEVRSDLASNIDCEALTRLEQWHYNTFDPDNGICYLGLLDSNVGLQVADTVARNAHINVGVLANFHTLNFASLSTNLISPFAYASFAIQQNSMYHCTMECVFDPEDKCDFFFLYSGYCYLCNYNTVSPIASTTASVTAYIYKGKKRSESEKKFIIRGA